MDKILFARRLKARRIECGYSSKRAFATAYDRRYKNGAADLVGNNPHKSTQYSLKNYENEAHPSIPSVEVVANMCEMLDCDIDYLLGKIDHPKHIYEAMNKECGLSDRATEQLVYWKRMDKTDVVNMILESANFDDLLYYAKEMMKALPSYLKLSNILQEKKIEEYSKPECDPSKLDTLKNRVKGYETRYEIARLHLSEQQTFLIEEMERLTKEKHNL